MANGRLGKQVVSPLSTVAIYTNSSGAEASISVIAYAENPAGIDLRIDDSTDALELNTTLASETWNSRYISYDVGNTSFTTGTPTYLGRLQFKDQNNSTTNDHIFEFYSSSGSTTYTIDNVNSGYNITTCVPTSWDVYNAYIAPNKTHILEVDPRVSDNYVRVNNKPTTQDEYYERTLQKPNDTYVYQRSLSYYQRGMVVDYQNDIEGMLSGAAVNTNNYMSGFAFHEDAGTALGHDTRTSDSCCYRSINGTTGASPNTSYQYPTLRVTNKFYCIDTCGQGNTVGLFTMEDSYYDPNTYNYNQIADNIVNESRNSCFRFDSMSYYDGGKILFWEYNPKTELYYLGYRHSPNVWLFTINRSDFMSALGAGQYNSGTGYTNDTTLASYGITREDITSISPFTMPNGNFTVYTNYVTSRSMRIGESLWALVFTEINTTDAPEVFYSTDLKTWVHSDDYYGTTYDYYRLQDATTITSSSGVVSASKTNMGNVGTDGILETNTSMVQYERTGLVLSDDDRIVAYNRSPTEDVIVQVMGYEGV